jgi:hypothetical protein
MKSLRLLAWSASLGLVVTLHAQPNSEIPIEFRQIRNNAFSVGVRYIGGADIKFGNLGTVPSQLDIPALTGSAQPISYTDGAISLDGCGTTRRTPTAIRPPPPAVATRRRACGSTRMATPFWTTPAIP